MKRIYLDHASTTYLDPRVKKEMDFYWIKNFGNPSAIYEEGRTAKKAISEARANIASIINSRPNEIVFTAGGTESDNLAILGVARALRQAQGKHIITSKIEHHAILHACEKLQQEGFEVSYIGVDKEGVVDLKQLKASLRPETILVSIMYANNEIGTIQPIREIAKIVHRNSGAFFHTDAVQAPSYLDLNVVRLGVDLMTLNGSKIYGPKGIGILYVRGGVKIESLIYGGGQEFNLRSGTENAPAIIGFSKALEIVQRDREKESQRLTKLRDYFIEGILKTIPDVILNGSKENRLPNNINVSFRAVEGESVVLYLDARGIACSTGSACSSSSLEPSHVIMALRMPYAYAHGTLRFSLGRRNKRGDIDYVLKILPEIIKKLRSISALDYGKKKD